MRDLIIWIAFMVFGILTGYGLGYFTEKNKEYSELCIESQTVYEKCNTEFTK